MDTGCSEGEGGGARWKSGCCTPFDLCWSFIIQEQEKVYMKKDNNREINSKISF
jgi:hypothetical protein